jgi:hypothetical protein
MLLLPLLLQHPGALFDPIARSRLRAGKDALAAAGLSWRSQIRALVELAGLSARTRTSLAAASTADIEWNGEPMDD